MVVVLVLLNIVVVTTLVLLSLFPGVHKFSRYRPSYDNAKCQALYFLFRLAEAAVLGPNCLD